MPNEDTMHRILRAAKLRAGKSSNDELDEDLQREIDFAVQDLRRIGVAESFLADLTDGMILSAILARVRAYYCMDSYHDKWKACYDETLIKIKGDSKYFVSDN